MRKARAVTLLALFVGALSGSAEATTIQIGSFTSDAGNYSYNGTTGQLTGSTLGTFLFDSGAVALLGAPSTAFNNATLTVSTDDTTGVLATPSVFPPGTRLTEGHDGSLTITQFGTGAILLKAVFTGGFLTGIQGERQATLLGADTLGTTITYSSDFFTVPVHAPYGFSFILNPLCATNTSPCTATNAASQLQPGTGAQTGNFRSFFSPDSANFSGTVNVPEPASLTLFGLGLGAAGVMRL
jgi:hypothetical protein